MKKTIIIFSICSLALLCLQTPAISATTAEAGDLIKMEDSSSVYFLGGDLRRYVFPNSKTYYTWFDDFSSVVTISQEELQSYLLVGNVTFRAGVKLVKLTTDPKVYAVAGNGVLRWVTSETIAQELYGPNWASYVEDVPDVFFNNYSLASDILDVADYNLNYEQTNDTWLYDVPWDTQGQDEKYCETDTDCISLNGCDAGCWNDENYVRSRSRVCPTLAGPEKCLCHQNECTDVADVVESLAITDINAALDTCDKYDTENWKFFCYDSLVCSPITETNREICYQKISNFCSTIQDSEYSYLENSCNKKLDSLIE